MIMTQVILAPQLKLGPHSYTPAGLFKGFAVAYHLPGMNPRPIFLHPSDEGFCGLACVFYTGVKTPRLYSCTPAGFLALRCRLSYTGAGFRVLACWRTTARNDTSGFGCMKAGVWRSDQNNIAELGWSRVRG